MNILYINHYAGSIYHGMEFRPYYLAREWVKCGHKVTIVAGDYSHLRSSNPTFDGEVLKETIDDIDYVWIKTGAYEGNGIRRAMSMFRFVSQLWHHAKSFAESLNPDVVISSSTYPLDAYPARRIAKIAGAKHIHEIHDMWPSTLIEVGGMSKHHPFVLLMGMAENYFCKKANAIVSVLPNTKEYLIQKGARPENIHIIPNGIVQTDWNSPEEIPEQYALAFNQMHEEGKCIVGYFGGHALSNALDVLVDAASHCKIPEIQFVLVGDGVEKHRLIRRTEDEGIRNITFFEPVKKRAIPSLLNHFDIVIITGLETKLYRFGGSLNKLFDAMMAAKPILMIMDITSNPVEITGCGVIVKNSKCKDEIQDSLQLLYEMSPEERINMGQKGKDFVESEHDYCVLAKKFEILFV